MGLSESVAIFYNKKDWHTLASDFALPHLDELNRAGKISEFYTVFSVEHGEHLKIFLNSEEADFNLTDDLIYPVQQYLLSHPSFTDTKSLPFDSLFCDFPNNSVYASIFQPNSWSNIYINDCELRKLRMLISELILTNLSESEIDAENVFSFHILLQFVLAKELFSIKNSAYEGIKEQCQILMSKLSDLEAREVPMQAATIIESNAAYFSRLLSELFGDSTYSDDLSFLSRLGSTCRGLKVREQSPEMLYMEICGLIQEQLNFQNLKLIATSITVCRMMLEQIK